MIASIINDYLNTVSIILLIVAEMVFLIIYRFKSNVNDMEEDEEEGKLEESMTDRPLVLRPTG